VPELTGQLMITNRRCCTPLPVIIVHQKQPFS